MSKYPGNLMPELQALVVKMRDPLCSCLSIHPAKVFYSLSSTGPSQSIKLLEQLELPFSFTFPSLHPHTLHFFRAASSLAS